MKTAAASTSGSTIRVRLQITPGGTRPTAATATSTTAQATQAGHAEMGVDTPTTVTPTRPRIFARGSRRWTGLARSPTGPAPPWACQPPTGYAVAWSVGRRVRRSSHARPRPTRKTPIVPTKPATPVATRSFSIPGKA